MSSLNAVYRRVVQDEQSAAASKDQSTRFVDDEGRVRANLEICDCELSVLPTRTVRFTLRKPLTMDTRKAPSRFAAASGNCRR